MASCRCARTWAARAVGPGASHAERARFNATRAIRAALAKPARAHSAATIRTGRYCSYPPDQRAGIAWEP